MMGLVHSIVIVVAETMVKKIFLWMLPILIIVMGIWVARYMLDTRREVNAQTLPSMVAGDPGDFATIQTQAVRRGQAAPEMQLYGQLLPLQERTLLSPAAGLLQSVEVRPGQRVGAGEALLRFDSVPLERAVRQAELALAQAQRLLLRNTQLLASNAITAAELADAETQRDQATLNLESAQAALADATVRAPFSGVVQQVMVQAQDRVGPNEPLLHLVSVEQWEVVARLPAHLSQVLSTDLRAHLLRAEAEPLELQLERWQPMPAGGSLELYFSGPVTDTLVVAFYPIRLVLPPVTEVIQLPLRALYDNEFVYRVTAQAQLERVRVEVVGFVGAGEQQQVIFRSDELRAGDPILTTRLRNATQGLPVLVQERLP